MIEIQHEGGFGDASKLASVREVARWLPDLNNIVLSPVVLEDLQRKIYIA